MRTRTRIHPYVAREMSRRLAEYSAAKGLTESAVVEAALDEYLDGGEKDGALILRRLDQLGRAAARQQRDLEVLSEAFAVYVRFWAAYLPTLSQSDLDAARREGSQRYERFVEVVSSQLASGSRFAPKVMNQGTPDRTEPRANDDDAGGVDGGE
jgi:hypothetical protein